MRYPPHRSLYLTKGSRVEIAGSIHYIKWEDRERGQMRYGVEIRAQRVLFLDPKPQAGSVGVEDLPSDLGSQPEPEPAAPVIEQPKKRQRRSKRVAA